ncbi:hypothetical protein ZWY2020_026043 [Hordeum vulgare]|nr:hypothetical protein ZWY2020_026043 [Hordeum vulgare]
MTKCVRSSSDPTWLLPFRTRGSWSVPRSGLAISSNHSHWFGWEQRAASISDDDDDEGPKPCTPQREPSPERPMSSRSFGAEYRRKRRQRPPPEPEDLGNSDDNGDDDSDRRFGLLFTRKHKRAKLAPFGQGGGDIMCSSSRELASSVGLLEDAHFLGGAVGSRSAVLVVLVDASSLGSSSQFSRFLQLPVLLLLRWRQRSHVRSLASFLLASPTVATAFALHGVGLLLYDGECRTVIGCKMSYVKQFRILLALRPEHHQIQIQIRVKGRRSGGKTIDGASPPAARGPSHTAAPRRQAATEGPTTTPPMDLPRMAMETPMRPSDSRSSSDRSARASADLADDAAFA